MIFVASLSEFDHDDSDTNRMIWSITYFSEISNGYFKDKPIFLFLNKVDIFKRKMAKKDLTCLFPEYKGGNDVEAGIDFIKMEYLSKILDNPDRVRVYVTNAMDDSSVLEAFTDAQEFYVNFYK
jgi:guanine nucleotide-binding protein G(i) subunit alpha